MQKSWHKAVNFRQSVRHAWRGLKYTVRTEKNFLTQVVIFLLALIVAAVLKLSLAEFVVVLIMSAALLAFEMVNTALEMLADVVQPEYHEKIGLLKDVTAGAVLIMSVTAVIVGILIYGSAAVEILATI